MTDSTAAQRYVLSFGRPVNSASAEALEVSVVTRTGSIVVVDLRDQSELHGLMRRIESLGLKLLSVNRA